VPPSTAPTPLPPHAKSEFKRREFKKHPVSPRTDPIPEESSTDRILKERVENLIKNKMRPNDNKLEMNDNEREYDEENQQEKESEELEMSDKEREEDEMKKQEKEREEEEMNEEKKKQLEKEREEFKKVQERIERQEREQKEREKAARKQKELEERIKEIEYKIKDLSFVNRILEEDFKEKKNLKRHLLEHSKQIELDLLASALKPKRPITCTWKMSGYF